MSLLEQIRDGVNSSSCQQVEALNLRAITCKVDKNGLCSIDTNNSDIEFLEAFDYPGFKSVKLWSEEIWSEQEEERILRLNWEVLEKLCSVLATYPFQLFTYQAFNKGYQIHGRILEALFTNRSLKELYLEAIIVDLERFCEIEDEEETFSAVNGQSAFRKLQRPHSTLSTLHTSWWWPLSPCEIAILASDLSSNSSPLENLEISYHRTSIQHEGFCALLASLATNTTLHSLSLRQNLYTDDPPDITSDLASTFASALSNNTTLHSLQLVGLIARLAKEIPSSNTTFQNLCLGSVHNDDLQGVDKWIQNNKAITSLKIVLHLDTLLLPRIIRALEKNTTLTSFSLSGGSDFKRMDGWKELYEAIIDLLSINVTLKTLDLSGTMLERNPAWMSTINKMLSENEGLRAALGNFPRVQPSTTRLFFCGHGFAGKTTLRKTMVNLLDDNFGKKVMQQLLGSGKQQGRTTGIEVTSVNRSDLEIFFWDLAGQREYHAFHDLMFPNEQGPSLFLIVCSLTHNSSQQQGAESRNLKTPEEMLGELRYWLRYISSNTMKIACRTPHVSFIFTHIDMLVSSEMVAITKDLVEAHTRELEQEFDSVAKVVGTFFINGRKPNSVRTLVQHALKESKEIVNSCQSIYSVCNNARKMLAEWMKDHPHKPWMEEDDFILLCRRKLPEFKIVSGSQRHKEFIDTIKTAIKAVLSSLHQTGNLIYFKNLGIVLVNLQWFCKDFMGGILEKTTQVSKDLNLDDHKGVWKREEIKCILERLYNAESTSRRRGAKWNKQKGSSSMGADEGPHQLDVEQLVDIMIQLELCFEVNPGNDLFIPATFCRSKLQTRRRWSAEMGSLASDFGYVGRRLKCDDEKHTFLTPGFFPRFQVHLKNVFNTVPYELEKDLIKIVDDRLEVLIEFNEAPASFIDIMVRFPKSKALDHVLEFISNKVIHNIRDLQSSTGCWQGVYLVEVVLRPSCVENLIMPEIKMKQSHVSLEELSSIVLKNDLVQDIENITYAWHSLEAASLGEECTPIVELLGEKCFTGILAERLVKVEELSEQLGIHDGYSGRSSNSNMGKKTPAHANSVLTERDASMYGVLKRIEAKIDAISVDIKDVKGAVDRLLEQKERLMPEVQKLLAELRNLHHHGDINAVPHFFLFNKERNLISKLVPGMSNFRLHFMCESHPMPHLPLGQEGIGITTLDEGAVKSILPYLHFLLSTLALGFRLGAPIAQSHGLMVPDLSSLIDSLISASRGIVDRSKVAAGDACTGFDPVVIGKARIWLQALMREKGCDNSFEIQKRFGLMKKHFKDGKCAWLCDHHYRQAL